MFNNFIFLTIPNFQALQKNFVEIFFIDLITFPNSQAQSCFFVLNADNKCSFYFLGTRLLLKTSFFCKYYSINQFYQQSSKQCIFTKLSNNNDRLYCNWSRQPM